MFGDGVIITQNALAVTTRRTFPESKHRSKRIRKKLIQRYGEEFITEPAAFQIGNNIIMHPKLYEQLKEIKSFIDFSFHKYN